MIWRILELLFADKSALAKEGRTRTSRDFFAVRCRDPCCVRRSVPMGQCPARHAKLTDGPLSFVFATPLMSTEEQPTFRCRLVMPAAASP